MIRIILFSLSVILNSSLLNAQKVNDLIPWVNIDGMSIGSNFSTFQRSRTDAKPLIKGNEGKIDERYTGVYYEGELTQQGKPKGAFTSYTFKQGKLVNIAWEKNTYTWKEKVAGDRISRETFQLRKQLIKKLGDPEIRYIAKIQFDEISREEVIVKVVSELFDVPDNAKVKVYLSSSSNGIRVSTLNLAHQTEKLIFSYEQDVEELLSLGLQKAEPTKTLDYLAPIVDKDDEENRPKNKVKDTSTSDDGSRNLINSLWFYLLGTLVILAVILFGVKASLKKKKQG